MKHSFKSVLIVVLVALASAPQAFAGGELWSYEGATGPDKWGELSPAWAVCSAGRYQSPIDLRHTLRAELGEVGAEIKPTNLAFGLDGPTFAVPYQSGSMLTINNTVYELQQFHFHHQSEHTLEGRHFPLEAHLVLRSVDSDHANAVLGIFIEAGRENEMLKQLWGQLPRAGRKAPDPIMVNVGALLPRDTDYYMYEGSMTTPGCRQGVRWFVLEEAVEASQAQIDRFIDDLTEGMTNNRPIQPTLGRPILKGR